MNAFSRFIDIINANINAALDKAEDPEKMLRLLVQELEDAVIETKSRCASDMAALLSSEKKAEKAEDEERRWEERAKLAVSKGKDDLAREAISERREKEKEKISARESAERLKSEIEKEKKEIESLEEKLAESKKKLRMMIEKNEKAKSEGKARESERRSRERRFEEMERKIERAEGFRSAKGSFEDEEIEKELEALKRENNGQN